VEDALRRTGANFVATDQYGLAAKLARDLPPAVPVIGIGPRWLSFDLPAAAPVDGATGILVEPERRATPIWHAAEQIGTARREHNGVVIETYRLYRVIPDHSTGAVLLPRRAME